MNVSQKHAVKGLHNPLNSPDSGFHDLVSGRGREMSVRRLTSLPHGPGEGESVPESGCQSLESRSDANVRTGVRVYTEV